MTDIIYSRESSHIAIALILIRTKPEKKYLKTNNLFIKLQLIQHFYHINNSGTQILQRYHLK